MNSLTKLFQPIKNFYNSIKVGDVCDYNKYQIQNSIGYHLIERLCDEKSDESKRRVAFAEACGVNYNSELAKIPMDIVNKKVESHLSKIKGNIENYINKEVKPIQTSDKNLFETLSEISDPTKRNAIIKLSGLDKESIELVEKESDLKKKMILQNMLMEKSNENVNFPMKTLKYTRKDNSNKVSGLSKSQFWEIVENSTHSEERKRAFCKAKGISDSNHKSITKADLKYGRQYPEINIIGLMEEEYQLLAYMKSVNPEKFKSISSGEDKKDYSKRMEIFNTMSNSELSEQERKLAHCKLHGRDTNYAKYITVFDLEKSMIYDKPSYVKF